MTVQEKAQFGERLAEYLRDKGISPEVFAARIFDATNGCVEIAASTVHRWLSGDTTPREGTQRAIAKVMGCDVADLF